MTTNAPSAGLFSIPMELPRIYSNMTDQRLIISGNVVILGVIHRVKASYVACDPSLNCRAWNVTEAVTVCPLCFNVPTQLSLF